MLYIFGLGTTFTNRQLLVDSAIQPRMAVFAFHTSPPNGFMAKFKLAIRLKLDKNKDLYNPHIILYFQIIGDFYFPIRQT